ncbi:hypothetical protein KY284_020393 [Solanum tuberosum]|nr:hypothetical protein KY284_020393 [Solanum tuberosum]
MDKKDVRCIFVGCDSQQKGWQCCDPTTGKCYTSQNVIFDEASSWWSANKGSLPDSNVFQDVLDSSHSQLSLDGAEGEANEDNIDEDVTQNPWQTGIYQQPGEEGELIGVDSPPSLRRSIRIRKQNPNFANAAIVEDENEKEPETFEEAF